MAHSVVIPSKTMDNLLPCMAAVRKHEPAAKIVVIDDGLPFDLINCWSRDGGGPDIAQLGIKPFIFSRNMNLGIKAAGDDDVILLNDDALLKTPGGFSALKKLADDESDFGIFAPCTNVTGAPAQRFQGVGLREVDNVAFVCVYIPRRTINAVGLLDERFVTYGWDDNDYCRRVKMAGLKIGVYDFTFVDHGSLRSTFRGDPGAAGNIEEGRRIFNEKWGVGAA